MQDEPKLRNVFIDAGIEHIHIRTYDSFTGNHSEILTNDMIIKNNEDMQKLFREFRIMDMINGNENSLKNPNPSLYITGKLSEILSSFSNRVLCQASSASRWAIQAPWAASIPEFLAIHTPRFPSC